MLITIMIKFRTCARWDYWKLHVARYNTALYVPAPPEGMHNFVLPQPELYDLEHDPDKSCDIAPKHPEIVQQMLAKMDGMLASFPEPVKQAWAETRAQKADPQTPVEPGRVRRCDVLLQSQHEKQSADNPVTL